MAIYLGACMPASSVSVPQSQTPVVSSPTESTTSEPAASATATPSETPTPAPPPSTMPVRFAGLRSGTYPAHLHSRCSGAQAFHITVLQSLVVRADGSGSIQIPPSYFNRGLCVIVYSGPSLSVVVATRPI